MAMTNLPPFTEAVSSTLRSARGDRSRRKSEPLKREKIHPRASVPETPSKFRDSTTGVPPKSLTPDAAPPVKRQLTASSRGQTARSMFIGVHHCVIMNDPVRRIKFKPKSRGLLGIASGSTFRICDLFHSPPYETLFEGHKLPIVDFDWSNSDHLITGSSDKTVRIYNLTEKSTKAILLSNEVIAVRFHPLNHNLIAVSTLHSMIYFFNQSGKVISHCKISSTARCMDFSTDGTLLFFGCADGKVRWFKCTKDFQDFKYAGSNVVSVNRSINSISYRDLHTNALRIPSLLVNLVDSTIKLFRINRDSETTFSFYPWVECPVLNISEVVRSSFAPLPSESEEGFIATGSENQTVIIYVYPTTPSRDSISKSRQVDALQGHTGIVNDVSWNCDETLLASSDSSGMVIVWKRWKKPSDFQTPT
uniref:Anaphase-promoting complex subunit 4 WD40 domain-containing protein n=1 Tax=Arcella intermedia TaxID=1963864 RepID=A0A6B2L4L1_9EUKA